MPDTTTASCLVLTEPQFARAVGLSLALVRALRREGRLPHVRVGRRVLYLHRDAEQFLEANRRAAAQVSL